MPAGGLLHPTQRAHVQRSGGQGRCLRLADMLSARSYEAQAPLKVRPTSLGRERACESVNAYMQVQ